jgi:hypothetical protein
MIIFLLLLGLPALAKDVTYRLTGVEPLTFTIPDDWSSGWSPIMSFQDCNSDDPVDLLEFHGPPPPEAPPPGDLERDPRPTLLVTANHTLTPLEKIQERMLVHDMETRTLVPAKEIRQKSTGRIIGYFNRILIDRPGHCSLDASWNLGPRTWSADITYPVNQPEAVETLIAILESVRLADSDTSPPTPRRPVTDGVEDADFPEEFMKDWRTHHGIP